MARPRIVIVGAGFAGFTAARKLAKLSAGSADIIVGGKLPMTGGRMKIPSAPGVGVELDRDRLAAAHEVYLKCGMRDRDDATTMRMVEPGWERTIY